MHSKNQNTFKAIHHLQCRESVRFLLLPLILRLYNGCHLYFILSLHGVSFLKVKVLKC